MTASLGLGTYRVTDVAAAARNAAAAAPGWVDTAPNYARAQAHQRLAPVLADHPALAVATKVGFVPAAHRAAAVASGTLTAAAAGRGHCLAPSYVRWQVARARLDLGRHRLDRLLLHNPEHGGGTDDITLLSAFETLEDLVAAGHIASYGVATWEGFSHGLTVERLDRLAAQAAGTRAHHLRTIQLPVSLVEYGPLSQALDGRGPLVEARARGWEVQASAPLGGGALTHPDLTALAELLRPGLTVPQACLLAVASCPGISRVLVSASTRAHWKAACSALARDPVPAPVLREVLDVLAPD